MANDPINKNLGTVTAYGYAKSKGYTGTEEEFAELMADYATVGQQAAAAAQAAAASAQEAQAAKDDAESAASSAQASSSDAASAASTAAADAQAAAGSADAASSAQQGATAAQQAAEDAQAAAEQAATESGSARDAAQTAQQSAEDAQGGAVTAQGQAEQAASSAQASAQEAHDYAEAYYALLPTDEASGAIASFDDGAGGVPVKSLVVQILMQQPGSGDPSPDNIRPISGWTGATISRSGADMSTPTTMRVSWEGEAGTVYGGTLDVTTGLLTVDSELVTITGGCLNQSTQATRYPVGPVGYVDPQRGAANRLKFVQTAAAAGALTVRLTNSESYGAAQLSIRIQTAAFASATACTQATNELLAQWAMEGTPLQVVYGLAEPKTYQLTPAEVTTLLGVNNIWADTGDSAVAYRADVGLYIDKKLGVSG